MIAYVDGVDSPHSAPSVVAAAAGLASSEVLVGWVPGRRAWLDGPDASGLTFFAGQASSTAVAEGRLRYVPVRLSALPRLVSGLFRPDIAVVTGIRRGQELVFGASVGWGPAAARAADAVVVEIDDRGLDLGGPPIPGRIVATLPRPAGASTAPDPRGPDEVDRHIGRHVASLLPEGSTLQVGPGGIAEAVMGAIDQPIRVHSGLVSEAVASLDSRGLLLGPAVAAYAWGGRALADLFEVGRLRMVGLEQTHDLGVVSAIDRFVACNTALEVGLDGSVNVERVGGRLVAGIGGHADFCAGAVRSAGGMSVIALRSTTRSGASTIVAAVEVTSTPRCDVEIVVTEHGVADLRGVDDVERRRRIAGVAAPEYRPALIHAAASLV